MTASAVPPGYCHCGCGEQTPLATQTSRGLIKGQPLRFVHGHQHRRPIPHTPAVTPPPDEAKAAYAEELLAAAAELACAVRERGPVDVRAAYRAAVTGIPAPDGVDPAEAFAVILAAAWPLEAHLDDLVGWVRIAPGRRLTSVPA